MADDRDAQVWFPFGEPDPAAAVRLFCFPYAGGGALTYRDWQRSSPPWLSVAPVQLPGRGERFQEAPEASLEPLVGRLADALWPHVSRPYALFGHSMGALIAFELAHRLMRRGAADPTALFVSGHAAPHLPRRRSDVHLLPPPQFLATLRELNGTPQELLEHPEILDLCLPRLRADWSVVETYEYQHRPPLNVEIDVFGGASDPEVSAAELYAWRQHGTKELQCRIMPGDHFFIYESGAQVFDSISRDLKRAIAGSLDRIQPHYS